MELKQGTIIDMGAKPAPASIRGGGVDGEVPVMITDKGDRTTQTVPPHNAKPLTRHPDESRVADEHEHTTKPPEVTPPPTDESQTPTVEKRYEEEEKTPEELLAEKRKEAEALFDRFGKHLDPETKERLMEEYLNGLLSDDKQEEEGKGIEDTFAEIKRLLAIMMALFMILIFNPEKTEFTGKDLGLEEKAPDSEGNDVLSKMITGKTIQDSWDGFRKEVDEIGKEKPVPFGEFMSLVLAANKRNSVKQYKLKEQQKGFSKNKKSTVWGRITGWVKRRSLASNH